jgi:hypothetical protein
MDKQILIKLSEEQHKDLKVYCASIRTSMSDFIKSCIFSFIKTTPIKEKIKHYIAFSTYQKKILDINTGEVRRTIDIKEISQPYKTHQEAAADLFTRFPDITEAKIVECVYCDDGITPTNNTNLPVLEIIQNNAK